MSEKCNGQKMDTADRYPEKGLAGYHSRRFGTIKECIYYGVPMLVIPLDRDQPSNAKRIQFHKLGLVCGIGDLTASTLTSYILSIVYNDEILNNVTRMKEIFQKKSRMN